MSEASVPSPFSAGPIFKEHSNGFNKGNLRFPFDPSLQVKYTYRILYMYLSRVLGKKSSENIRTKKESNPIHVFQQKGGFYARII
jgi:hypothetical protein